MTHSKTAKDNLKQLWEHVQREGITEAAKQCVRTGDISSKAVDTLLARISSVTSENDLYQILDMNKSL